MARKNAAAEADRLKGAIVTALRPGKIIRGQKQFDFVIRLYDLADEIDDLPDEAASGVELFFLTAVIDKANKCEWPDDEELDQFASGLLISWLDKLEGARISPTQAARIVAGWLEQDEHDVLAGADYAIWADLEICLQEFEHALAELHTPESRGQTGRYLREVFFRRKDVDKYISACAASDLTFHDQDRIVTMLEQAGRTAQALEWALKGAGHPRRAALLAANRRYEEASEIALQRFEDSANSENYDELMRCASPESRVEIHAKAMDVLRTAHLENTVEVCMEIGEKNLLARRIESASDHAVRDLSDSTAESAAKMLAGSAPTAAARLFRSLALRILEASRVNRYRSALGHLAAAKECLDVAGHGLEWNRIASEIQEKHYRKAYIKLGFPAVLNGRWTGDEEFI